MIIQENGAIISEYALGTQPTKGTFPARNRVISGLSRGILVTEAGEDSGALITAQCAKDQEKPVFAVPGPITSAQSVGTAKLIQDGALLIQSAQDIIHYFTPNAPKNSSRFVKNIGKMNLGMKEKIVLEKLIRETKQVNALAKEMNMGISDLNIILTELELKGIVTYYGSGEVGIAIER